LRSAASASALNSRYAALASPSAAIAGNEVGGGDGRRGFNSSSPCPPPDLGEWEVEDWR
jgi:hypothetical protein